MRCQKLQQLFEVQSFGLDRGAQSFCYSFIALSIILCSKTAKKFIRYSGVSSRYCCYENHAAGSKPIQKLFVTSTENWIWFFSLPKIIVNFLPRVSILTRDIDIANLSVCLSVRPSVPPLHSGIRWKRLNILSPFFHYTVAQSFTPASVAQSVALRYALPATVFGESGFEAQAGRIIVSGYSGVCFEIKFSGRHRGFDGVLFNLWPLANTGFRDAQY